MRTERQPRPGRATVPRELAIKVRALASRLLRGVHPDLLVLAPVLAGFYWLTARLRPLPQIGFGQDLGILLDVGWRFMQGQMPHRDYMSPLGPAYALIAGIPLAVNGVTFESYGQLPFLMCCAFSLTCLAACRHRLPWGIAVAYSVMTGMVGGGTYHFGFSPELLTFATVFNRYGWAALMILTVLYSIPRGLSSTKADVMAGVLNGATLAFLLFLKINYFVVAVVSWAFFAVVAPHARNRRFVIASGIAFLSCSCGFLQLIGWSVGGMLRDLTISFQSRRESWVASQHWAPLVKIVSNTDGLVLVSVLAAAAVVQRAWRLISSAAIVIIGGFVICNSNSSGSGAGIPVITAAMVVIASGLAEKLACEKDRQQVISALAWGLFLAHGFLTIVVPQAQSFMTWRYVTALANQGVIQQFHNAPKPMGQLVVGPVSGPWANRFVDVVRDATELKRTHVSDDDTLLFVDFTNVINFATGAKSPRYTSLWYDRFSTLCKGHKVADDIYFSDVDFVLVTKLPGADGPGNMHVEDWMAIYGEPFRDRFDLIDESACFALYRKKT